MHERGPGTTYRALQIAVLVTPIYKIVYVKSVFKSRRTSQVKLLDVGILSHTAELVLLKNLLFCCVNMTAKSGLSAMIKMLSRLGQMYTCFIRAERRLTPEIYIKRFNKVWQKKI